MVLGRNGPFLTIFMVFLGCFWPFFLHSLLGVKIAIFDQKTSNKHQEKCQMCPKQVGLGSQPIFGIQCDTELMADDDIL